ncbi:MAG: hypothetical protein KAT06_08300 [Gammaproteobacteria bacterium]|nr:hypothetical protein [Gammaproteobacteria bacterium]
MNKRSGDTRESPYRTGRFYSVDNEWFFSVRELDEQGPYFSKLSAEIGLKMYLLDMEHFKMNKTKSGINDLKLV